MVTTSTYFQTLLIKYDMLFVSGKFAQPITVQSSIRKSALQSKSNDVFSKRKSVTIVAPTNSPEITGGLFGTIVSLSWPHIKAPILLLFLYSIVVNAVKLFYLYHRAFELILVNLTYVYVVDLASETSVAPAARRSSVGLNGSTMLPQHSVASPLHYCEQTTSQTPAPVTRPPHDPEEDKISS